MVVRQEGQSAHQRGSMEVLSADEKQAANDLVTSATEAIASVKPTMDAAVAAHAMLIEQQADQKAKAAIEEKADNVATSPGGSQSQVKLSDLLTAVVLGDKTQMMMANEDGQQTVFQYSSAEGLTQDSQYVVSSSHPPTVNLQNKNGHGQPSPSTRVPCHTHPRPFSRLLPSICRYPGQYVRGDEQAQRQGSVVSVALKDGSQVMANSAAAGNEAASGDFGFARFSLVICRKWRWVAVFIPPFPSDLAGLLVCSTTPSTRFSPFIPRLKPLTFDRNPPWFRPLPQRARPRKHGPRLGAMSRCRSSRTVPRRCLATRATRSSPA